MPTYLVESYQPKGASGPAAIVAARLARESGAQHRWSLLLPDEDLCLHLLDGPSARVVHEATVRAELRYQRISQVVVLSPEHPEIQGGSP
jgi:hypothetical protein